MARPAAVLWDADGVLQQVPASWMDLLGDVIGTERSLPLLEALLPRMEDAMSGRVSMTTLLPSVLDELDLAAHHDAISEVWGTVDRLDTARDLVRSLRAAGVPCHLATNQDDLRASYMRSRMGYDELLDRSFYSCEVGAAKPSEEYFTRVAEALDLTPDQLAFVDDSEENVVAARRVGVQGIHWHDRDGVEVLTRALGALDLA